MSLSITAKEQWLKVILNLDTAPPASPERLEPFGPELTAEGVMVEDRRGGRVRVP